MSLGDTRRLADRLLLWLALDDRKLRALLI
jgi:hypothetical protein